MLTYDDLARACRENDKASEEEDIAMVYGDLGTQVSTVVAVAEQRAIRAALQASGKPLPKDRQPVDISPMGQIEFMRLQAAVMDGIAIGLRAALNAEVARTEQILAEYFPLTEDLNRSTEDDLPKQP
jgi:hypothetical protein